MQRGMSLMEILISFTIASIIFSGLLSVISAVTRTESRNRTAGRLTDAGRGTLDEILYHLRSSDAVLASTNLNATTYTTSNKDIAFTVPAYNPSQTNIFLNGVTDTVAFTHNTADKTVRQTVVRGTGSARPNRANFILAKNVQSLTFTYRVREQYISKGLVTYTLAVPSQTIPVAFVNGARVVTSYSALMKQVTFAVIPPIGADVQIMYTVNPNTNSGAYLANVTTVEVGMTLSQVDATQKTQLVTISGSARLRNRRL